SGSAEHQDQGVAPPTEVAYTHVALYRSSSIFSLQVGRSPYTHICLHLFPTRALQDRWRNDQARDSSERTIFANKGQACLRSSLDISCRKGSAGHPHDRPCDPAQGQKGSKSHA